MILKPNNPVRIVSGALIRLWYDIKNAVKAGILKIKGAEVKTPIRLRNVRLTGGSWKNVYFDERCTIGNVDIYALSNVRVGKYSILIDRTRIITGSHDIDTKEHRLKIKPVIIEDFCFVGEGAVLLPGAYIEFGAVVGACVAAGPHAANTMLITITMVNRNIKRLVLIYLPPL